MMSSSEKPQIIRQLLAGIRGFQARYYERWPDSMRQLVEEGQKPQVLMIGCSDSRVDPALLTQAEPGELFVVRNVANLVPPYQPDGSYHGTSAAIEYAVRVLNVGHVIVLGHAFCGGIQGLIRLRNGDPDQNDFVSPWVSIANAALAPYISHFDAEADLERLQRKPDIIERAAVRISIENLMTFPFVNERIKAGTLTLHGWWFDLETGDLWAIDPQTGIFRPIE